MRALTFRRVKHANNSSKSFVIGSLKLRPLLAKILDRGNAGVGRHRTPEFSVRAPIGLEGIVLSDPDIGHLAIVPPSGVPAADRRASLD
jgi:hypothetical protein